MPSRIKKIVLAVLAVALLAGGGAIQPFMNRDREALGLTRIAPLDNAPPVLAFTTVALGGFRGLISNALWMRANELQEQDKFFEMSQLADWITKLEPHFVQVWLEQAWNMAYNISVKFKANEPGIYTDRWRWVQRGIELLRDEGLVYNPNELLIYRELAWIFQNKMGAALDDAHMFYKQQWVIETSQVFGSTNLVSLEALADPKDADLIERATLLREKFKMDPEKVLAVDKEYGPLDWRLPETHAIYWGYVGLEVARTHPNRVKQDDIMTLRRVIYQSMQTAFQRGRLVPDYFNRTFEFAPNLTLIPKVDAAYRQQMVEDPEHKPNIATGHRNFLREAVYALYIQNREAEAARWFKVLGDEYPDKPIVENDPNSFPRNVTLDHYCVSRLGIAIGEADQKGMRAILEALLMNSYRSLLLGDEERAEGYRNLATRAWTEYQPKVVARQGALDMPPLSVIDQEVRRQLLDPGNGLPPEMAAQLRTRLGLPAAVVTVPPSTNAPVVAPTP